MVGCTKELWAWPHPWGVAGAKIETAWGYRPGEGVCTRSHMAHAGHTLTGPKPNNWISIFFWPTFDRWPSFVRLSRGCFPNGESIALVFDQSLAFVCSSVTWLLPQWRRHRIGLRLIVGLRLFICHVAASPMAKALHWLTFDRLPSFASLLRGCFPNGDDIALALDPSLALVYSSVTWLLPQ